MQGLGQPLLFDLVYAAWTTILKHQMILMEKQEGKIYSNDSLLNLVLRKQKLVLRPFCFHLDDINAGFPSPQQ